MKERGALMSDKIAQIIIFVKEQLAGAEAGHDWFHIERVWKTSLLILKKEQAREDVVNYAALLHDIADSKFHRGDEEIGPQTAAIFLRSIAIDESTIEHVVQIIRNMSFKASLGEVSFHSKELEIVQDADRLDAIGAIGIARAFHFGGFKNREIYNPAISPQPGQDKTTYKNSTSPTINHFYEKLLLLKERMNTQTAREIAEGRHTYMENFLQQFYAEWRGTK